MNGFDIPLDRRGTRSLKWDTGPAASDPGLLPMWVADMDFAPPPEVAEAVGEAARRARFGYAITPESFHRAVVGWMARRFGWIVGAEAVVPAPGVVPAIYMAIQAFTRPGDAVVIQTPVYHLFASTVAGSDRRLVRNPLIEEGLAYRMDLDGLEAAMRDGARLLLLCSPHNPVGRVWRRDELEAVAGLAVRHGVTVVADEIHEDLVFAPHRHVPFASLGPAIAAQTVTLVAPSKTFNLAGLQMAAAIVEEESLRRRLAGAFGAAGLGLPNAFGAEACEVAYTACEPWLEALLGYLAANDRMVRDFVAARMPQLGLAPLEGTYLAWIDCRSLGLDDRELRRRLIERGRVWLDEGPKFGPGGEGFERLNIACPRARLADGLERIARALGAD